MERFTQVKVGLLGGGQLARMLAMKGHELGLQMYVLSKSKEDPAAQVTSHWFQGDPFKAPSLEKFLSLVDVATFESEFLNAELLQQVSKKSRTLICPHPLAMSQVQDRWSQKVGLQKAGLPVAPFYKVDHRDDLLQAWRKFQNRGMVLKKRRFGYDGYGTFIIHSEKELQSFNIPHEALKDGLVAEAFENFKRELAILAARNRRGEICFFPLVETRQRNAQCFWVKGPVEHQQLEDLKKGIITYLEAYDYEGVMAFELFDQGDDLLMNEVAPRVHNSGHYSLEALCPDQFTVHLLSILNQALPSRPMEVAGGYAMVNLLGCEVGAGGKGLAPKWEAPLEVAKKMAHVKWHWYGKKSHRVNRKMGHMSAVGSTGEEALRFLLDVHKGFQL